MIKSMILRRGIAIGAIFLLIFVAASAQSGGVTGIVTDIAGEPLIGVNVRVKGTDTGAITDVDGRFVIRQVQPGATLVASYIGYVPQEIVVGRGLELHITLIEATSEVEEVVVVGYGTQKKVNLTGSVSSVKGDELAKRPIMSTVQALQGMAAGVTVTSNSGQPGKEGESIRIRGIGTLNNNDPLVLVDGVAGSLNAVASNDIESISILKDAASSAIYGSRASNGVILITTKRAKDNEFTVGYNATLGWQNVVDQPKFLGAIDYLELYDMAAANDARNPVTGEPGGVTFGKDYIENYRKGMASDPYRYPDTDWAAITYRSPAFQQQHNLSFSGGSRKFKTLASFNFQDQYGIFPDTYLKRYSVRVNSDYVFSDHFSAGIDVMGRYSVVSEPRGLNNAAFTMGEVRRMPPIYAPYTPSGKPAYMSVGTNTWATAKEEFSGYNRNYYQEGMINLKMSYSPFRSLKLDFAYAPRMNFSSNKVFVNKIDYYRVNEDGSEQFVQTTPQTRILNHSKDYSMNGDLKILANFSDSFGKHNLTALAGFQQIINSWEQLVGRREGSDFTYDQLNAFPVQNQTNSGSATEWALQSWFGRINYDFAGRYLLEANVRYDGSSRFALGYKWGIFPSFSAGWRVTEESFMKNVAWLDNLKLRASWGQLGNQEGLGEYPFSMDINLSVPVVFNRTVAQGYAATNYAIRNITWETTTMTDVGFDLAFLTNRLDATFDYYIKRTSDILLEMDIPAVMGYGNRPRQNAGEMENKGWDLTLSWNDAAGKVNYRIAASLSDVNNRIVDMKGIVSNHSSVLTNREGYPINSLWGLVADGLFPSWEAAKAYNVTQYGNLQGGDVKYIDRDGNGLINGDDYTVIGNTIPRYAYSLDFSAQYRGFDLGFFFQGVGKRDSYLRGDLAWAFNNGGSVQQWQKDGMWREGQTNAIYPRMFIGSNNNVQTSTYWLQDASYLRLKNLQLGYSFSTAALKKSFIKSARIYITGQNLITFKHMISGYDPEQSYDNARDAMPLVKTYAVGVNLNF
jgi:TonB-linked SusC/RagA family outer membrane protein